MLLVSVPSEYAASWLEQLAARYECSQRTARNLAEASEILGDATWYPELVLVYQGIPDQFAAAEIECFVGLLPMTRCVVVFGPWCESIGRTEQLWPIGWCVPLQHAETRITQELAAFAAGTPPVPATTSRDEAFVGSTVQSLKGAEELLTGQRVRIWSLDHEFGRFLTESIVAMSGTLSVDDEPADIELIAATLVDDALISRVEQTRASNSTPRVLVVSDMASPQDTKRLLSAGCDGVLSQLRFIEQFSDTVSHRFV
ncbi:MAG: hypothetical protein ACYTGL_10605 [Planctomycetota bacterium]